MSNPNVPSSQRDRRLRVSRVLVFVLALIGALALGFFLLREKPAPAPSPDEAPKGIAALFGSIQGNVKTRGVGGLDWRTADIKVPLRKSDLVRTYPSSSAEIQFSDETRVTVRPDSLITIEESSKDPDSAASRVAWKVTSGEINYETTRRDSGSTEAFTPTFRLSLEGNSAGTMRVGEGGLTAVAQLKGVANIETKTGEKIRLGANEGLRVDASGKAGAKQVLPEAPSVQVPGDASGLVSLAEGEPAVLSWSASVGSAVYRVQVEMKTTGGREAVFDRDGLKGTSVNVPGLLPGDFVFWVAGQTQDGIQGKPSSPASFRVERTAPDRSTPRPLPAWSSRPLRPGTT